LYPLWLSWMLFLLLRFTLENLGTGTELWLPSDQQMMDCMISSVLSDTAHVLQGVAEHQRGSRSKVLGHCGQRRSTIFYRIHLEDRKDPSIIMRGLTPQLYVIATN
jgi:hypothetical protein